MADQKLTDRSSQTTSTDNALVHVVDGGVSYKQTKANLLKEDRVRLGLLEANQISGVLYFETYADMIAASATGSAGTAYKVIADTDTTKNGDYSSDGTIRPYYGPIRSTNAPFPQNNAK